VVQRYIAAQLRKPHGAFGRALIAPLLNRANAAMNERTLTALDLRASDRVLEVGFGGGALLNAMAAAHPTAELHGADFSRDMVLRGAGGIAARLICASVDHLPYAAATFTRICTVNTIYFWPDCAAAFAELRRVLAPGGRLVVAFGDAESMGKMAVTRYGFSLYQADEVAAFFQAAGFASIERTPSHDGISRFWTMTGIMKYEV
jgi:arsenite methyltransferase